MKALIFGSNGQDGYYLSRFLRQQKIEAIGISRSNADVEGSVADSNLVRTLITEHQPSYIFHLAANSTTRHEALMENHETISTGTLNIMESVRKHSPLSRVFISGSGMQFLNTGTPINESTPFHAGNAYAISRIQSVFASRYFRSLGLHVYVGYFFNHESPLRSERHVSKMVCEAVKRIASGSKEQIVIGDLSTKKEWAFAGDIMEGVWMLINQEKVSEAIIGSGKAYSIEDWLAACFRLVDMDWHPHVREQSGFKAEYDILVSDPALMKSLGWVPKVDLNQLASLMMKR